MKKQIEQVKEFHKSFNIPILKTPQLPNVQRCDLRQNILEEEVCELRDAMNLGDIVLTADAIIDCMYVLIGTAHEFGLADMLEQCFDEVHRSNMSKLGADGRVVLRADGKVLKSSNYFKPNLSKILNFDSQTSQIKK